ncbi:hypothetical protein RDABS01_007865, partial [Bienertia sinuspersici]
MFDKLTRTITKTPLLKTPSFIKKHAFNMANKQPLVLMTYSIRESYFSIISLNKNFTEIKSVPLSKILATTEIDWVTQSGYFISEVIGSCYGLVCLSVGFHHNRNSRRNKGEHFITHESLVFWNPFTQQQYLVPNPNASESDYYSRIWGFGYDTVNETFKLVIAKGCLTQIYHLSTNSWEIIESMNWSSVFQIGNRIRDVVGKFLRGSLHWIASYDNIVALNLTTKACNYIPLPNHNAISCNRIFSRELGIWVMKEYGKLESWVKQYTIVKEHSYLQILKPPLWISEDGELLF